MKKLSVYDHDTLIRLIDENKYDFAKITLLFTGTKREDGSSWCPDCNEAEPVIEKCLNQYEVEEPVEAQKTLFITVSVGIRDE